jgi:hypothetical protein
VGVLLGFGVVVVLEVEPCCVGTWVPPAFVVVGETVPLGFWVAAGSCVV